MTRTIKVWLIFIFLVVLTIILPNLINLSKLNNKTNFALNNYSISNENINNNLTTKYNKNKETIGKLTELDIAKNEFLKSANSFYSRLYQFKSLYIFEYFQENLKFKNTLLLSSNIEDYKTAVLKLEQANYTINKIINSTESADYLTINLLLNDDNCTNALNLVYQCFLIISNQI